MPVLAQKPVKIRPATSRRLAFLASVKLTVLLLSLTAATVLIGAWCPQEGSGGGWQKAIDMFGENMALTLRHLGITDIFHSNWFLFLIGALTVNMLACSMQRVFPKAAMFFARPLFFNSAQISKLPEAKAITLPSAAGQALDKLEQLLRGHGFAVSRQGQALAAEWGKFGRLAPSVTHIGLLTLLVAVTITAWTGFSGFQPTKSGGIMDFQASEHSKLWIGKLPRWRVRVDATRREDYPGGEPKQWYSDLTVVDASGKVIKRQQISVNNPLSFAGVDIYQSSWALDQLAVSFNGRERLMSLKPMGKVYASFLPLDDAAVLIFSVRDQIKPLKVFGKTPQWDAPRLLAEIPFKGTARLGSVSITYKDLMAVTGLQYKCDPGFGLTLVAFAFITAGVLLAAVPYCQVWACAESANMDADKNINLPGTNTCILSVAGRSVKGKSTFARRLDKILCRL